MADKVYRVSFVGENQPIEVTAESLHIRDSAVTLNDSQGGVVAVFPMAQLQGISVDSAAAQSKSAAASRASSRSSGTSKVARRR